ncbi:serine/threonine-protein kinase [Amycolatopsis japonica]|uniref:serine/threonine-protein kinase n=1 Tax=Amycolatopsis japonica TaxID=208439 RepID=UPI0037AC7C7A
MNDDKSNGRKEDYYELVSHFKTEGQGELWIARHSKTNKEVIVKKLLLGSSQQQQENITRFNREVRTQSRLLHAGIMPILAYNFDDSPPWYAMPKAEHSLADLIKEEGKLSSETTAEIILAVLDAIEYAHNEGIVHRDLKPANILLLPEGSYFGGQWVVADFGLCLDRQSQSTTITKTQTGLGSIAYMAPEQFKDAHRVGATADVYALGQIMYHCLSGEHPFPTRDIMRVPSSFRYLVHKATENDRERRFLSIAELKAELAPIATGEAKYENARKQCETLIGEINAGGGASVGLKLYATILQNASDQQLLLEVLPLFNLTVFESLQQASRDAVERLVSLYDSVTEGAFPFSFVDRIADFFLAAFSTTDSLAAKRQCIEKLLQIGYSHNRFYVRDELMSLFSGLDGETVAIAVDALNRNLDGVAYLRESGGRLVSLPAAIRRVIESA